MRDSNEENNIFLDARSILFRELSEDIVIEISKLHNIVVENISHFKEKKVAENLAHSVEAENDSEQSPNWQRLLNFLEGDDSCCTNDCLKCFDKKALMAFAYALDSCSKSEVEAALLMNMREHSGTVDKTKRGYSRKRQRVMYNVTPFGPMCREAFLRLWGKGERSLRNLREYQKIDQGTFAPRIHGNANLPSHYALSPAIHQSVIDFVNKIGNEVGEESEGRHLKRNNYAVEKKVVRFLPAFYSVALLYRLFLNDSQGEDQIKDQDSPLISLRQFYYLFNSPDCASVQLRSPRSDVCDICLLYRSKMRRDSDIVDENDEDDVSNWNDHVTQAKEARSVYRTELKSAQEGLVNLIKDSKKIDEYTAHITFDFAQNLGLPQLSDPPQEVYFTSLRSIQLFSIRDDGSGIQYNFLYDEGDGSKGANYVSSMLVLFLLDLSNKLRTKRVLLHADNCCSQNKNNVVLWVLELLVMLGVFDHIEFKFLVKGHTHCTVDGGHGVIKKEWRKRDAFSIDEVKKIIENCSKTQRAIILSSNEFFNWSLLLENHFQKLPGITAQQEFEFDKERFGVVQYRNTHSQQWQSYRLLKSKRKKLPKPISSLTSIQQHLEKLDSPGISLKKQWTLFKKMRKYVPDELKDTLCPKPEEDESLEDGLKDSLVMK